MPSLRETALYNLRTVVNFYIADLEALTDEQFVSRPNGTARPVADYTFETAQVIRRLGGRIKKETLPSLAPGWVVAPSDYKTVAHGVADLKQTLADFEALIATFSDDEIMNTVPTSDGESPIYDLIYFAAIHTAYHGGQVSLVQQLGGDLGMHWKL